MFLFRGLSPVLGLINFSCMRRTHYNLRPPYFHKSPRRAALIKVSDTGPYAFISGHTLVRAEVLREVVFVNNFIDK